MYWHYLAAAILAAVAAVQLVRAQRIIKRARKILADSLNHQTTVDELLNGARRSQAESQSILNEIKEYRRAVMD